MGDAGLKKLTTEQQAKLLAKEVARVEERIGELLKLLVSHYPQGLTRTEIKALMAVNTNPSFVSLYRNGKIVIDIERRYCDAAQENLYYTGKQYLRDVQYFRWLNAS